MNSSLLAGSFKCISKIRFKFTRYHTLHVYSPFTYQQINLTTPCKHEYFIIPKQKVIGGEMKTFEKDDWKLSQSASKFTCSYPIQLPNLQLSNSTLWDEIALRRISECSLVGLDCSNQQRIIVNYAQNFASCSLKSLNGFFQFALIEEASYLRQIPRAKCVINSGALKNVSLVEVLLAKGWIIEERDEDWFPEIPLIKTETGLFAIIQPGQLEATKEAAVDFTIIESE
jgi:hypothetical protein